MITKEVYFNHPYCSNSRLSAFGREIGVLPEIKGEPYEKYRLGTLVDAVITEPASIDFKEMKVGQYPFSKEEYKWAMKMKESLERDKIYSQYMKLNPQYQFQVFKEGFSFGNFVLNMKAKLDYYVEGFVADLKTTACTTQKQFNEVIRMFGYDRQMVLYCRLTGAKKAILFGVGKDRPHSVFSVMIKEGDKIWKEGEEELSLLTFKYYISL